ncbi:MAG: hypothetical protein RMN52_02450 [Anaerolineae bacterium]|nr:hypothetical protein [Candidatus Roseilinea sp.]MDW8448840.1 hypothetical protein [Anaerolineae bacterium]
MTFTPNQRHPFDLLVLWAWEYDADFIALLARACAARDVSAHICGPDALPRLPARLDAGEIRARVGLDRVWDWGGEYEQHVEAMQRNVPLMINDYARVRRIWNKLTMHMTLIAHGLYAPHLILLPSYEEQPNLSRVDLTPLGDKFSVKSVHSGGSGVLEPVTRWEDVLAKRREWPGEQTILQAWVEPQRLGKRRAWFRVFYACGSTFPCWADDRTHVQEPVSPEDESRYQLGILRGLTQQIAGLCGLNLFSTEIALDQNNLWQVCDYVNDPCDFRLKSTAANGVPDEVVVAICDRIAGWVKRQTQGAS